MITLQDMKDKLLTFDQLVSVLEPTEDLQTLTVTMDGTGGITQFVLPPGWNVGLKQKDGQDLTEAKIGIGSKEYLLTKDAVLAITSAVGLQQAYVYKTPGPMIQSHLNYWATHSVDANLKVLAKDGEIRAVTKAGIKPFSNIELLNRAHDHICGNLGVETKDIMVDYKSHHDLRVTNMRLIVSASAAERVFSTSRSSEDRWNYGVEIRNSLTGQVPLGVRGYMFAWECTNGQTSQHAAGKYNRKTMGQNESEVYQWAADAVDKVLGHMEHEFDLIKALTTEDVQGGLNQVLADIFRTYKVPLRVRKQIMDALIESGDTTYYGIQQAITSAANNPELSEHFVTALLEIGGDLAHDASQRCDSCLRVMN